jgi:thioredoxin-related protein
MKKFCWAVLWAALFALPSAALAGKGWLEDLDQGLQKAAKENKYVLVDFSGSDWCGWCIKLDEEVFSKTEFKDYAEKNLVLVLLDFPRRRELPREVRERNEQLLKKYGVRGFPTVLILNPKGEVIGRTGYRPGGPQAYIQHLEELISADRAKSGAAK